MIAAERGPSAGIDAAAVTGALRSRAGGFALIVVGVALAVLLFLESTPVRLGFDDTDSPAVSLRFLRAHSVVYGQAGVVLIVLATGLIAAVLAAGERVSSGRESLAARTATVFGLFSAAFFLGHAAVRLSAGPVLHIDRLSNEWGAAAYVTIQMVGTHLMAQAGLLTLGLWAAGIGIVGWRTRALPRWLCLLAIVPAMRLVSVLGPLGLGDGPEVFWIAFMLSIVATPVWLLLFGLVLLRRPVVVAPA